MATLWWKSRCSVNNVAYILIKYRDRVNNSLFCPLVSATRTQKTALHLQKEYGKEIWRCESPEIHRWDINLVSLAFERKICLDLLF